MTQAAYRHYSNVTRHSVCSVMIIANDDATGLDDYLGEEGNDETVFYCGRGPFAERLCAFRANYLIMQMLPFCTNTHAS